MMDCSSSRKDDLISLNRRLLMGMNCGKNNLKRKRKSAEKTGWKAYDTGDNKVKNHIISENVVREHNKDLLDFDSKAVNPVVYPNLGTSESDSKISDKKNTIEETDSVTRNIKRDNVLEEYQSEKKELFISPTSELKTEGRELIKNKYFITQVRNYISLVKKRGIREKLHLLVKYLHNSPTAKELKVNDKGHVQRGLFDTQTKFSAYLNYYILASEGQQETAKKPPFYDVVIGDPLSEFLALNDEGSSRNIDQSKSISTNRIKTEGEEEEEDGENRAIIPLRSIKEGDLNLENSLIKMKNILTNLNIDVTSTEIDRNDYEDLIDLIAFPIYATNPTKEMLDSRTREYSKFADML